MAYNYDFAPMTVAGEVATALGRLSADELSAILAARHIEHLVQPNQSPALTVSTVAAQLTYVVSITQALRELSLRDLTVLRVLWRSGLSVTARSIAPAFAGTLDKATVERTLKRLLDMALVLPQNEERSALFVPAAVRAVLVGRNGPPRPAAEVFASLNADVTKAIHKGMGLPPAERNRKADFAEAIVNDLSKPEAVRERIAALSPLARSVFEEVAKNGGTGEPWGLIQRFPALRKANSGNNAYAGYGGYGYGSGFFLTGREAAGKQDDAFLELQRVGLLVRYPPDYSSVLVIVDEVLTALLPPLKVETSDLVEPAFVPPPDDALPAGLQTAPVLDFVECLQFITDEKPSLTQKGLFPKPQIKRLARFLSINDTVYADLLMALTLSSDLIQRSGSALSVRPKKCAAWLAAPEIEQRDQMYDGWYNLAAWQDDREDPCPRTADVHVPVTLIRAAVAGVLAELPEAGATIASCAARLRYGMPAWFDGGKPAFPAEAFGRHDPEAFVRGVLRDLGRLGCVEPLQRLARQGAAAEVVALRLTPLGRAIVREAEPAPDATVPRTDRIIVQPTLDVLAPPNVEPAVYQMLRRFADAAGARGMRTLTLSPASLRRAFDTGMKPQAVRKYLEEHASTPLPSTVERLFDDVHQKYGRIHVGQASFYLTVDDPHLLVELKADKRLQGLFIRPIAPTVAAVSGASLAEILAGLRGAGHMPVADGGEPAKKAVAAPAPAPNRRQDEWLGEEITDELLQDPAFALATLGLNPNGRSLPGVPNLRLLQFPVPGAGPAGPIAGPGEPVTDRQAIGELIAAALDDGALVEMEYIARVKGVDQRRQVVVEPFDVTGDAVWATDQETFANKSYKLNRIAWARLVEE